MTIRGYPDQKKLHEGKQEFVTVNPVREQQNGADVVAHMYAREIGTDTAEAASTTRVIAATGHAARRGDIIAFTAGNLNTMEFRVYSVDTDTITMAEEMPEAPANGDAFSILRNITPRADSSGSPAVTVDPPTAVGANTKKGKISGASLTGSYATVLALTFDAKILQLFNSCDATILISLDGGVTESFELEAGESTSLDLRAATLYVASGVNISAKHAGAAPTSGTIRATAIG